MLKKRKEKKSHGEQTEPAAEVVTCRVVTQWENNFSVVNLHYRCEYRNPKQHVEYSVSKCAQDCVQSIRLQRQAPVWASYFCTKDNKSLLPVVVEEKGTAGHIVVYFGVGCDEEKL